MARHALLIATTQHSDPVFSRPTASAADVRALAGALRSPDIGGFDSVTELVNRPSEVMREEIEGFFQGRSEDDLVLLYVSGHGVVNARGLHLVSATTKRDRLAATAIPADFVRDQMDGCRSRKKVLILDCCYSGTADRAGANVGTATAFAGDGSGRIVLTATDATEFAFETDDPTVDPTSRFTHFLAEGLQGGAADLDGDGRITIDELYEYTCRQLVTGRSKRTPGKWSDAQGGGLLLAKNPRPVARPELLSPKLLAALASTERWEVEGAVRELVRLSGEAHAGLALAAREKLDSLVKLVSARPPAPGAGVVSPPPFAETAVASTPPAQSAPGGSNHAVAPPTPGTKSYASLRPKSVRTPSPESTPTPGALLSNPPAERVRDASGAHLPAALESATPDQSFEPSPAPSIEPALTQGAAAAIPTPPVALFATGAADAAPAPMPRSVNGQPTLEEQLRELVASHPGAPLGELPSSPAQVPPAALAGKSPLAWVRNRPRVVAAGATGLLGLVLVVYLVARKGSLNVEVRPPGNWAVGEITIIVDGEKRCSRTPCRVDGLSAGGHEVAVTALGYARQSVPVAVSRGAVTPVPITLELDGPTGIAVGDLGSDVQLFVDGHSRGNVPQELNRLAPGEHVVLIQGGERYQPFTARVLVEPGKMISMAPKLKVKKGRVTIQSGQEAEEAKIELVCGGQHRPAPKQAFDMASDPPCKVVATRDGFEPFEQGIQFNDGQAEQLIRVDLVAQPGRQKASSGISADGRAARLPERQSAVERPRLNP